MVTIGIKINQLRITPLKKSINCVKAGSGTFKSVKIFANTGIKKIVIPKNTITAKIPTATG